MSAALDIAKLDLPTRKNEAWKYTDLSVQAKTWPALQRPAHVTSAAVSALPADMLDIGECTRVVFIDGMYCKDLSDSALPVQEKPDDAHGSVPVGLQALSIAAQPRRFQIAVAHSTSRPVHIVMVNSGMADTLHHLDLKIIVSAGVEAHFIEEHVGGRQGVAIHTCHVDLGAQAQAHWLRLQHTGSAHTQLAAQDVHLDRDAKIEQVHVEWGGRVSRLASTIHLEGTGAHVGYHALSGINQQQHVDHQVCVRHAAPHCSSRLRTRGIVGDSAKQVFSGKILVERGAQKTDSDQLLRHLLLSDKAEVDAKPELEIYADDVRCAHGSTVGRLDEHALFYLRSRGIAEENARRLLMVSFADSILAEIPQTALADQVRESVAQHLSLISPS